MIGHAAGNHPAAKNLTTNPESAALRCERRIHGLYAIRQLGDSMQPTIRAGDVAFIDPTKRNISAGGIFAIHNGFGEMLCRLQHVPGSEPALVMVSLDNPKHGSGYEVPLSEVEIVGLYVQRLTPS